MPNRAVRWGWFFGVLLFIAPFTTRAQQGAEWIYRGQMGSYAVLENVKDQSQQIVKAGKSIGGMRVVSFNAKEIVLSKGGQELRLKIQAGYSTAQSSRYKGIPAYPWAIPSWWSKTHKVLDSLQVTPRWTKTAPAEILRQLMEFSGVQVAITPKASLRLSQHSGISLNANRMTLRESLDLVGTMLALRWWIHPGGIQYGLSAEVQGAPEAITIQQALSQARQQVAATFNDGKRRPKTASDADKIRQVLSESTITTTVRSSSLGGLFRALAGKAGVTLVIDPSVSRRLSKPESAQVNGSRESVNELLVRLTAQHKLGYLIEGSVVHLTSQQQAAVHSRARVQAESARRMVETRLRTLHAMRLTTDASGVRPHELVEKLRQTLGVPVYCDRACWDLDQKLNFGNRASFKTVSDKLIATRIYPVFTEKALFLIRGR